MKKILILNILAILFILPFGSAAHYIVGIVENARDGTNSNGKTILLWNSAIGIEDNLSDMVGPLGNSGVDNIYMIDCELLSNGCDIGNILTLKVIDNGDRYVSEEKNVTVGGFGYTLVGNITLNSPPNVTFVIVEDDLATPENEIDLIPADIKEVICNATITEYDGEYSIIDARGVFFDNVDSSYGDFDDNNTHYSNNSCEIDYSYGTSEEVKVSCKFNIWYYANSQNWNCSISVSDNLSINSTGSDNSFINPLLALGLVSQVTFTLGDGEEVTDEKILSVTNYGNVKINLSLSGYGDEENDGLAMNCTSGFIRNISIEYEKFNLTKSTPGNLNLSEFEKTYKNLTSYPVVNKFNLDYRKNELFNEAINDTYWRLYVPTGIGNNCHGNIVFGAVRAPGV